MSDVKTSEGLTAVWEKLPGALKTAGTLGSLCGFIYLLAYVRSVGIPFPLEVSVLPTVLLVVGVTAVVGTLISVGGVLVPAIMTDDPLEVTKEYFLARKVSKNRTWVRFLRYMLCSWLPMAAALYGLMYWLGVVGDSREDGPVASVPIVFSGLSIAVAAIQIHDSTEKRTQYAVTMLIQTFLSVWAYALAIILLCAAYPDIKAWDARNAFAFVLLIFTVAHMMITFPQDTGVILKPPHWEYKVAPMATGAIFILIVTVVLSVVTYPTNARVGRAVLRLLNAGGGVPAMICLKNKPPEAVVERIGFSDDYCSASAAILFDAGDKVYVSKTFPAEAEGKGSETLTEQPVYFRQDEVREKIYLPSLPKPPKRATGQ